KLLSIGKTYSRKTIAQKNGLRIVSILSPFFVRSTHGEFGMLTLLCRGNILIRGSAEGPVFK
ncbi:MAG: hypothetical protein PHT07_21975, partial [Paludibacter sp.]|nr:hypothetical protein [Paludibacter sp.]